MDERTGTYKILPHDAKFCIIKKVWGGPNSILAKRTQRKGRSKSALEAGSYNLLGEYDQTRFFVAL